MLKPPEAMDSLAGQFLPVLFIPSHLPVDPIVYASRRHDADFISLGLSL